MNEQATAEAVGVGLLGQVIEAGRRRAEQWKAEHEYLGLDGLLISASGVSNWVGLALGETPAIMIDVYHGLVEMSITGEEKDDAQLFVATPEEFHANLGRMLAIYNALKDEMEKKR